MRSCTATMSSPSVSNRIFSAARPIPQRPLIAMGPRVHLDHPDPGASQVQTIGTRVTWEIRMDEPASSEERRRRLDLLVDEASMLSFPASDPPAVFVDERAPSHRARPNRGPSP